MNQFDVAENLGTSCLFGKLLGAEASGILLNQVRKVGQDTVWNVSFSKSMGIEYAFAGAFLGHILDKCGKELPPNVVLAISGRGPKDRSRLISGLAWEPGDVVMPAEPQEIDAIRKKGRFCIFSRGTLDNNSVKLEYVGTAEDKLLALLAYLDGVRTATAREIEEKLHWQTEETAETLRILVERRQIFRLPRRCADSEARIEYVSILNMLRAQD
ncbi:MAG: hypothetical protein HY706_05425 [Candidatus Hydrogenedentes bacterium]|nr:hypothetical protein [Candidatus Hydrogenedentota bacterium]